MIEILRYPNLINTSILRNSQVTPCKRKQDFTVTCTGCTFHGSVILNPECRASFLSKNSPKNRKRIQNSDALMLIDINVNSIVFVADRRRWSQSTFLCLLLYKLATVDYFLYGAESRKYIICQIGEPADRWLGFFIVFVLCIFRYLPPEEFQVGAGHRFGICLAISVDKYRDFTYLNPSSQRIVAVHRVCVCAMVRRAWRRQVQPIELVMDTWSCFMFFNQCLMLFDMFFKVYGYCLSCLFKFSFFKLSSESANVKIYICNFY